MKKGSKIIGLCAALCIVGLNVSISVMAATNQVSKAKEMETYVNHIKELNEELATRNVENIPSTITLNRNITYEQLVQYVANHNLEIAQLQARGIDANGNKVTFASKTSRGLYETDQILRNMAYDEEIEFLGYNGMYVRIDSEQITGVEMDNLTFLLDTSIIETPILLSEETEIDYPHSLAWTLEEMGMYQE